MLIAAFRLRPCLVARVSPLPCCETLRVNIDPSRQRAFDAGSDWRIA
jgi:hypothetical protein